MYNREVTLEEAMYIAIQRGNLTLSNYLDLIKIKDEDIKNNMLHRFLKENKTIN